MSVLAWGISTSLWGTHHLTYMYHSRVRVKIWNEISREYLILLEKSFKKKSKWALLNSLTTKDSYMEPDGIILNFKHGKIETNWTSPTISFVHLETLGLFLLYNKHLSFSLFSFLDYFLMSFYVLLLHLCVISSVIRFKQVKFTVVKKKNWPASISIWYLRVKEISGIYIYIYIILVSIY